MVFGMKAPETLKAGDKTAGGDRQGTFACDNTQMFQSIQSEICNPGTPAYRGPR
jgi:hypothetical protein